MEASSVWRGAVAGAAMLVCVHAQRAPLDEADPAAVHPDRLCVKLAEGTGAELRSGRLVSRTGRDLRPVAELFTQVDARPLVTAVPWDELDRWHRAACALLPPHNRPGHLGLWFQLRAEPVQLAALREQLRAQPLVEHAHHEPRLALASVVALPGGDLPPATPSFAHLQLSLGPPPTGHGVRAAAGVHGARGTGIGFVMLEDSFVLDHEDVCQLVAGNFLGPVPPTVFPGAVHGLSGASIVAADRNAYGTTGIADEVAAHFASVELNGGIANAIAAAVAATQPGDVVLIVLMVLAPPLGLTAWVPFEFYQTGFDATLTATSLGRHLVVPAGNGNLSLDDPVLLNRFDRTFRDSGAIIVGASNGPALQRAPYSTWGTRVDAHSWGEHVVSCGGGTLFLPNGDWRQSYTAAAGGTSSATPHLAGIAAAIQGAAKTQLGGVLTNAQLVALLHAHGPTTPDAIGRRPDLRTILAAIGAIDGLAIAEPDVAVGGAVTATMDGPPGSVAALFASFVPGAAELGFNRPVLLDLGSMVAVGAFVLSSGTASWQLQVPTDPSLHGANLYFQAMRVALGSAVHVTNSCQLTIL